jgi:hypothetical protein
MVDPQLVEEAAAEVGQLRAENERLRIKYGVLANPERVWQGECGHLWHHEGTGNPSCPTCTKIEQLRAALTEYAKGDNWLRGARFDPNSHCFDGIKFAMSTLDPKP